MHKLKIRWTNSDAFLIHWKTPNLVERDLLNKDRDERPTGEDESMWVPSESDSESEEIEGLGSDFEVDEKEENNPDDNYSFDVLNTKSDSMGNWRLFHKVMIWAVDFKELFLFKKMHWKQQQKINQTRKGQNERFANSDYVQSFPSFCCVAPST